MTAATATVRPFVAALGEHTGELLAEVGYTAAEVAALVKTATTEARG
jgi:crotonobetainyl-CoA:carnitine CoA-transferase CaiB-like acyl-CoA transferase